MKSVWKTSVAELIEKSMEKNEIWLENGFFGFRNETQFKSFLVMKSKLAEELKKNEDLNIWIEFWIATSVYIVKI